MLHTVVDLHDRRRFTDFKLKPQVRRTDCRREIDRVVFERPGAVIAGVDRIYGSLVQLHADEAVPAGVEVGSERQHVRLANGDDEILIHTRRILGGAGVDGARLIEFVSEY